MFSLCCTLKLDACQDRARTQALQIVKTEHSQTFSYLSQAQNTLKLSFRNKFSNDVSFFLALYELQQVDTIYIFFVLLLHQIHQFRKNLHFSLILLQYLPQNFRVFRTLTQKGKYLINQVGFSIFLGIRRFILLNLIESSFYRRLIRFLLKLYILSVLTKITMFQEISLRRQHTMMSFDIVSELKWIRMKRDTKLGRERQGKGDRQNIVEKVRMGAIVILKALEGMIVVVHAEGGPNVKIYYNITYLILIYIEHQYYFLSAILQDFYKNNLKPRPIKFKQILKFYHYFIKNYQKVKLVSMMLNVYQAILVPEISNLLSFISLSNCNCLSISDNETKWLGNQYQFQNCQYVCLSFSNREKLKIPKKVVINSFFENNKQIFSISLLANPNFSTDNALIIKILSRKNLFKKSLKFIVFN